MDHRVTDDGRVATGVRLWPDAESSAAPEHLAVVFADLVGFTTLAEASRAAGGLGGERVHALLDSYFAVLIEAVGRFGGAVSAFAGDALTAVFDGADAEKAWAAAQYMQAGLKAVSVRMPLPAGMSPQMRIGVGVGHGRRFRLRPETGSEIYFDVVTGPPLTAAVAAQRMAGPGEVMTRAADWGRPRPPGNARENWICAPTAPSPGQLPTRDESRLGDEHRVVTSAFVILPDLRIFEHGPGALASLLTSAWPIAMRFGGWLRQVDSGDSGVQFVLAFGAPRSAADDAERGVACCAELMRLRPGQLRAGIATGRVFCSELGTADHRERVVIGDAVNVAARLAAAAPPGAVHLDATTAARCGSATPLQSLGSVALKGRAAEPAYVLAGVIEQGQTPANLATEGVAFVGRQEELDLLEAVAARAGAGHGHVLELLGEPGIGKSRLVREALRRVDPAAVLRCQAAAAGEVRPFAPWRPVIREILALPADASPTQIIERLAAGGVDGDLASLLLPVLGVAATESGSTRGMPPAERAAATMQLVIGLVRAHTETHPVTLVVDDAHRLDELSAELLERLADRAHEMALLVIILRRSRLAPKPAGLSAEPGSRPEFVHVELGPLADAEACQLASALLAAPGGMGGRVDPPPPADAGTPEMVAARSGGHPLFLIELCRWVREHGVPDDGSDLELPDDIARLVLSRVDALVPRSQAALQAAAVLGREVTAEGVAACLFRAGQPTPAKALAAEITSLISVGLLSAGSGGAMFGEELVREVVYGSLNSDVRARLHDGAGRHVEVAHAGDVLEVVDVIAMHAWRARDVDRQRQWIGAAADAAESAYLTQRAIAHLERLIPLHDGVDAARLLLRRGSLLHVAGRWDDAEEALRAALAEGAIPDEVAAGAESALGSLLLATARIDEAEQRLSRAAAQFERLGRSGAAARALERLVFSVCERGDLAAASSFADRQLHLAQASGEAAVVAAALENSAILAWRGGSGADAIALMRRAHTLAVTSGERRLVVHTANDLAGLLVQAGDHAGAIGCLRTAIETAYVIGYASASAYLTANAGELYLAHGDTEMAARCYATGLEAALERGDRSTMLQCLLGVAETAVEQGEPGARDLLSRTARLAGPREHRAIAVSALVATADVAADEGDLDAALGAAAAAESLGGGLRERLGLRPGVLRRCLEVRIGNADLAPVVGELTAFVHELDPADRAMVLAELALLGDAASRTEAIEACEQAYAEAPDRRLARLHRLLVGDSRLPDPAPLAALNLTTVAARVASDTLFARAEATEILHDEEL